jgi:hypothetical protein
MATALEQFMTLFRGFENGHGQHELSGQPDASGKIKGKAYTKSFGASEKEYMAHLEGKGVSLGLIPLMADNRCWFGAIDIDVKGDTAPLKEPIEQLEARVRKLEFPLVVCRSKSGGAHLYLFCNEPILAKDMHARLAHFSQKLGYGGCELFPEAVHPRQRKRPWQLDQHRHVRMSQQGRNHALLHPKRETDHQAGRLRQVCFTNAVFARNDPEG